MQKQSIKFLVGRCIEVLNQGIELIESIEDSHYVFSRATDRGTVGTHFRHVLDFAFRFLDGVESGKIDYNRRERNTAAETKRDFAIEQFRFAIKELQNLPEEIGGKIILSHLEPGNFADEETAWCATSVLRELEFVQSHTLHHYALIALKLSIQGISVSKDFGVAPSTLDFWKNERNFKVKGKD
jgi:hypothetical protein